MGTPRRSTPSNLKSWEAFNQLEEEMHGSHTAPTNSTNYLQINTSQDSLTLPDSLNEFEGEEYQSPPLYPDSLRGPTNTNNANNPANKYIQLGVPEDIDSLQLEELQKHSPDSLNKAEYFDSITLEEEGRKRRIVPFDNSLSSGNSVFTSQDASFESSPPNNKLKEVSFEFQYWVAGTCTGWGWGPFLKF